MPDGGTWTPGEPEPVGDTCGLCGQPWGEVERLREALRTIAEDPAVRALEVPMGVRLAGIAAAVLDREDRHA